jgi:hypothetical protein
VWERRERESAKPIWEVTRDSITDRDRYRIANRDSHSYCTATADRDSTSTDTIASAAISGTATAQLTATAQRRDRIRDRDGTAPQPPQPLTSLGTARSSPHRPRLPPSRALLARAGFEVKAHDPACHPKTRRQHGTRAGRDLLATGTEQCPNTVRTCSQFGRQQSGRGGDYCDGRVPKLRRETESRPVTT